MGIAAGNSDTRTREDYEKEVAGYLSTATELLTRRAIWRLYRYEPALLHLEVANSTDLGYTGVRLTVHIPGDVKSYPEDWVDIGEREPATLPRPPRPLGTPKPFEAMLPNLYRPPLSFDPPALESFGSGPGYTVRDTGSVTVENDEFEVRPHETITPDAVPLTLSDGMGAELTATWSATAAQVRGRLDGTFVLVVTASTLDLSDLDTF
ncbi:hypothetical protein [Phytohabitans suffuscus]|uniref:Uncharacterized protein n=1 Tax=Phytohabitans suffuscus TaxID=624315 RepID=A0A6F8YSC6_9ACTN|nr:hypothetical protein [Phytohabitans suffuscus]BCB88838.1 hypothetical protein Psuf_061510 [Phytohabitans suffuscus]